MYEGVRDKLDRLRSEGHVLAIASNQGGCDYHEVGAESLNVGDQFKGKHPFDDDEVQVVEGIERLGLKRFEISAGGFVHSYWNDLSKVFIQHKTIDRTLNTNQEKTSAYHFCP